MPPVAYRLFEYAEPAVPVIKDVVVMLTGVAVTVTVAFADFVLSTTLVTVTVTVVLPVTVGA